MISARPADSRSIVASCSQTRTGSSEPRTVTELVSRMRSVRSAAAAGPTSSATLACSIVSRTRRRGDGAAPVTGSRVTSPNSMMPISNAISGPLPAAGPRVRPA
nr:hypothetical protein [Actinomadura sp. NEAU-AAG7]